MLPVCLASIRSSLISKYLSKTILRSPRRNPYSINNVGYNAYPLLSFNKSSTIPSLKSVPIIVCEPSSRRRLGCGLSNPYLFYHTQVISLSPLSSLSRLVDKALRKSPSISEILIAPIVLRQCLRPQLHNPYRFPIFDYHLPNEYLLQKALF